MKIDLINRARLEVLNKRNLKYNLQDAEKDYFLAVILGIVYDSELSNVLVFKGGTAIYHCYLEQIRFSRDLDFTAVQNVKIGLLEEVFAGYDILKIRNVKEKKYGLDFSIMQVLLRTMGFLARG